MSGDAKMLVREDGSTEGTVGGGCLEAEVWETAMSVLETGAPEKLRFDLTQQEAEDSGHICGGVVEILVEPFQAFQEVLLDEINRVRTEGSSAALATIVQPGDIVDVPVPESQEDALPPRRKRHWRDSRLFHGNLGGEHPDHPKRQPHAVAVQQGRRARG